MFAIGFDVEIIWAPSILMTRVCALVQFGPITMMISLGDSVTVIAVAFRGVALMAFGSSGSAIKLLVVSKGVGRWPCGL